jgi:site-specific DNA recombinase
LSNALYDGRLVWNKVTLKKDPATGKRIPRVNPESEWQTTAVPHLRIVDAGTFTAAQGRMDSRGHEAPAKARKPRHLLSGLLRCGTCGGAIVLKDRDSKGRRVYCARMHQGGGCTNGRAFYLDDIERRVLAGLEEQLKDPRAIERFLKSYVEERKRLAAAEGANRQRKETRLEEVNREFDRALNMCVKGLASEEETGPLLAQLREERKALQAELAKMTPPANVVTLHPVAVKRYLQMVNDLATSLPRREVASNEGISQALPELVSCVTITPAPTGPPIIAVTGRLSLLIGGDLPPNFRGVIDGSGGGI